MRFSTIFLFLFTAALAAFYFSKPLRAATLNLISYSPCDTPIIYSIGRIDDQFGISRDELLLDIKNASNIWSNAEQKVLFTYDPQAPLKVNLIYDERQQLDTQINQMQNQVSSGEQTLQEKITIYNEKVKQFKQDVQTLNQQIDYWNARGGAPKEEYNKLITEQEKLHQEAKDLNNMAAALNLSTSEYNTQVGQLNKTVNQFNEILHVKPEEGLYDPKKQTIDIYFSSSHAELIHTLTHELGHALGIGHNNNPNSIMYPYTSEEILLSSNDNASLDQACKKRTFFATYVDRLALLMQQARQ